MLYTLLKFLGWGLLLAVIGGCVGWALRSLKARSDVGHARSTTVDEAEVERMRHRLTDLEQAAAERDRLRMQLADMRPTEVATPAHGMATPSASDAASLTSASAVDAAAREPSLVDADSTAPTKAAAITQREPQPEREVVELDMAEAARVLGKKIKLDDLTVVEGIGPKIAQLCHGIGVTTWRALGDTPVADLKSMLDAAGSRYQIHNPSSWPRQARLLSEGRWDDQAALLDELSSGR